jgi:hypothetical protein
MEKSAWGMKARSFMIFRLERQLRSLEYQQVTLIRPPMEMYTIHMMHHGEWMAVSATFVWRSFYRMRITGAAAK